MKSLLLLATGGTIAGCADDSATLNDYTLGGEAVKSPVLLPPCEQYRVN